MRNPPQIWSKSAHLEKQRPLLTRIRQEQGKLQPMIDQHWFEVSWRRPYVAGKRAISLQGRPSEKCTTSPTPTRSNTCVGLCVFSWAGTIGHLEDQLSRTSRLNRLPSGMSALMRGRPLWAMFGQPRPTLAKIGNAWPTATSAGQASAQIGQHWPRFGRISLARRGLKNWWARQPRSSPGSAGGGGR